MPARSTNIVHHPFVKAVAAALRQHCGVKAGDRLIVATSGGADSVALLRVLEALAGRRTWRLTLAVGHVQHHLRPEEESEGDAAFVAELAAQFDLPLIRADLTPPRLPRRPGRSHAKGPQAPVNREAWGTPGDYAALAEMAGTFNASAIVTAHHADDQLETILMRMLRGASITGLAGIAWRRRLSREEMPAESSAASRPLILRPMLCTGRAAAQSFLRDLAQPWREDRTNEDTSRLRARLRHDVLPILREIRGDAAAKAVALGAHLRQASGVIDQITSVAADRVLFVAGHDVIDRGDARLMPRIVLAGLLRRLLIRAGVKRDRLGVRTLGPIVRAIRDTQGGRRNFSLGSGVSVEVTRESGVIKPGKNPGREP